MNTETTYSEEDIAFLNMTKQEKIEHTNTLLNQMTLYELSDEERLFVIEMDLIEKGIYRRVNKLHFQFEQ